MQLHITASLRRGGRGRVPPRRARLHQIRSSAPGKREVRVLREAVFNQPDDLVHIAGGRYVIAPHGKYTSVGSGRDLYVEPVEVILGPFCISQLLTVGQFKQIAMQCRPLQTQFDLHSYEFNKLGDHFPVVGLSWDLQKAIAEKLEMRLPTEAEWRVMALGNTQDFDFGGIEKDQIICWENIVNHSLPRHPASVQKGPKNSYGITHPIGNVWNLVKDSYHPNLKARRWINGKTNPCQKEPYCDYLDYSEYRVLLGGSWASYLGYARVVDRSWCRCDYTSPTIGCRLALSRCSARSS